MNGTRDTIRRLHLARWLPILAMLMLIAVLALYTNHRNSSYLQSFTLNYIIVATMPMALAAMGQTSALMVKAFDVSVGALMTVCLVTASYVLTPSKGWIGLAFGMLIVFGVAILTATVNVVLIRVLKLSSIIATLATWSILQGIALWLRPQPAGPISPRFVHRLLTKAGFMPVAFIAIVLVAIAADIWLYRSAGGLAARAMGLDEESAKRRGVRVSYLFTRAFFISAFAAAIGSLFLAAQAQIGEPTFGLPLTLTSISAAVLGGASLLGGRGSFVGAVVGALFLNVITSALPFLGWSVGRSNIAVGALTLLALTFYQAPELFARARSAIANFRIAHSSATTTSADATA
jgi:ribose transport system ATP-binding protein